MARKMQQKMHFAKIEWKITAYLACEITVMILKFSNVYRICFSSDVVSLILGVFFFCICLK